MLQASGRERPAWPRTADVPIQMHERPQEKNLKHVRGLLPARSPRTDIAALEGGTRRLAPRCLPNRQAEAADVQGVLAGSPCISKRNNACTARTSGSPPAHSLASLLVLSKLGQLLVAGRDIQQIALVLGPGHLLGRSKYFFC